MYKTCFLQYNNLGKFEDFFMFVARTTSLAKKCLFQNLGRPYKGLPLCIKWNKICMRVDLLSSQQAL